MNRIIRSPKYVTNFVKFTKFILPECNRSVISAPRLPWREDQNWDIKLDHSDLFQVLWKCMLYPVEIITHYISQEIPPKSMNTNFKPQLDIQFDDPISSVFSYRETKLGRCLVCLRILFSWWVDRNCDLLQEEVCRTEDHTV